MTSTEGLPTKHVAALGLSCHLLFCSKLPFLRQLSARCKACRFFLSGHVWNINHFVIQCIFFLFQCFHFVCLLLYCKFFVISTYLLGDFRGLIYSQSYDVACLQAKYLGSSTSAMQYLPQQGPKQIKG